MVKTKSRQAIIAFPLLFLPFIFLLGSLLLNASALAWGPTKPKNVLILFQGAPGQPLFDMTLSEVRNTIQRGLGGPLNLYVEYLDWERFHEKDDLRAKFDFIKKKYKKEKMDLFIPAGAGILPLISQYLSPDFDEIPTVFIEFRSGYPDTPPIHRQPNWTGVITEPNLQKTLAVALAVHPDATEALIITGSSPSDQLLESVARTVCRAYEH